MYEQAQERIENIQLAMKICKEVTDFLERMESEEQLRGKSQMVVAGLRGKVYEYMNEVMNGVC